MNIGLKNSHRNHSQVGLKQDMSNSFVGVKKDTNIKEKMGNVRHGNMNDLRKTTKRFLRGGGRGSPTLFQGLCSTSFRPDGQSFNDFTS